MPSVSDGVVVKAEEFQSEDGTSSACGLLREAGSVLQKPSRFSWGVAVVVTSPVVCADNGTEGVVLSLVAGAAPLADVAEVVATDATSSADAGILFPADPAGVVTIGVAPLADAGPVTMAVADLADAGILFPDEPAGILFPADPAGILFPADPAGTATADVVFLADTEQVTVGVAEVADAGILFPADSAGILFPADPAGILFPADTAGILFPADTARTDTADVAFLADAEEVTVGMTKLADAGILFPADSAGILFPADPAGILFPADPAGTIAADVAFLSDMLLLGPAGVLSARDRPISLIEHQDFNHQHGTARTLDDSSHAPGQWIVVCWPNFTLLITLLLLDWDPGGSISDPGIPCRNSEIFGVW